jgi:hypothetical protein
MPNTRLTCSDQGSSATAIRSLIDRAGGLRAMVCAMRQFSTAPRKDDAMSEDKIETDVEQTAEAFTDELSDEALDRVREKEGFSSNCRCSSLS